MNLYLDDDSASALLALLLRRAGHDVQIPSDAGLAGDDDAVHLEYAIRQARILLSHNNYDFRNLHNHVMTAGGHHSGVFVVCKENNPKRDLTERGIVAAIGKLLAANAPIVDEFIILNHWR